MKEKEIIKIINCPIYARPRTRRFSESIFTQTKVKENRTLPLKYISKDPYMRLNTGNSVGDIDLSGVSLGDSLEETPKDCRAKQYLVSEIVKEEGKGIGMDVNVGGERQQDKLK